MKGWNVRNFILPLVLCLFQAVNAAELNGKVSDADGAPVDFASIRIYNTDSVLVAGVVCDEAGCYSVSGLPSARLIVSAGCIGYDTSFASVTLDDAEAAALDFVLQSHENTLGEVTVTAERFVRTQNGLTVIPDTQQVRHASSGYELLRNLMIPGVSVDAFKGTVSALGGGVALYIDGMEADEREVRQLRPSDVERVQFMDAPTGRYAGNNTALNFILKKKDSGGYAALDALQRIGYNAGDYNLAMKYYRRNTQYTLFAGADYKDIPGGSDDRDVGILFPAGAVTRNYSTLDNHERTNRQYGQFRVRNKTDRRTLRATLKVVREATPENFNASSLTYGGTGITPQHIVSHRTESSRGMKYSLGLSGTFNLPSQQSIDASASADVTDNNYDYTYGEDGGLVSSATSERLYSFNASVSYVKTFPKGNSVTLKAHELYNVSAATYSGSHASWQHLWMSESLLFAEYMQPLGQKASLRVQPGVSAQFYRVHGNEMVRNYSPRAQIIFAMQPARGQYFQVGGAYGNSYPQLSMLTGATTQVDMVQIKRGNPDLKQSRLVNLMAVYGLGVGKVNLQALVTFMGCSSLPITEYSFEDGMLLQSWRGDGKWAQWKPTLSASWMPSDKFNFTVQGGWHYNRYSRAADITTACWFAEARASWYVGAFALNAYAATPQKMAGYDRSVTRTIWDYGMSGSWSRGALRLEAGFCNPFYRHPGVRSWIDTPQYRSESRLYTPSSRQSAYIKAAYTVDFGKKTRHDTNNVDKTIGSGIQRAI
mgnify:CR=1 FL=1